MINEAASTLGKLSAKKRFEGMSKEQISDRMKTVRQARETKRLEVKPTDKASE